MDGGAPDQEIEAKLVVVGPRRRELLAELAARPELAGLPLVGLADRRIHDLYLDTPGRSLRDRGMALRVRSVDGSVWLAVKAGQVREGLAVRRTEVEGLWSASTRERIGEALGEFSGLLEELGDVGDPDAVARRAAALVVQEREIWRRRRGLGTRLELDLDEVSFQTARCAARHCEIEIEALAGATAGDVDRVARTLLAERGAELLPWPHSKLATGEALAELLGSGTAAAGPGAGTYEPTAEDYRRMDARLRSR